MIIKKQVKLLQKNDVTGYLDLNSEKIARRALFR